MARRPFRQWYRTARWRGAGRGTATSAVEGRHSRGTGTATTRRGSMTAPSRRVALVTGASRGIGRALALGLAKAGWAVAVAAKSTASTDKLPGSIHTVAAEVEALGAPALAVQADVRDEAQIDSMVRATLDRFGSIELLVNNAGALH